MSTTRPAAAAKRLPGLSMLLARISLRTRMLMLVAVAAIPALAVLAFNQFNLRIHADQRLQAEMAWQTERVQAGIATIAATAQTIRLAILRAPPLADVDRASCARDLVALQAGLPAVIVLSVVTNDGQSVCTTDAAFMPPLSVEHALAPFGIQAVIPATATRPATVPLHLPITLASGQTAVAIASLGLDALAGAPIAREAGFDQFALTGSLLILGGALMSLGFGLIVGEHFLRRPADALMNAAGSWASGDLHARIPLTAAAGNEFGRIATTFNGMAEALGQQRDALRELNNDLEVRVTARTHELSESNRRLVGEMAERERAEAALRQAHKLQAVGQLAGGIAHDFNDLLTTIVGALDLLRGRLSVNQDTLLHLVDNALVAADRGGRLTAQLLSFSRRQRLSPVPTDMNATVAALSELLISSLGASVDVQTDLAADLWPAMVDPSQMEAAILNLAINARDAMPAGGTLTIATRNVIVEAGGTLAPGEYVAVQVADNGIGMAEDILNLAVEPFFTTKEPGTGSGLGLSQVYGLAAQSGGEVRMRSQPGEGTTVVVVVPRTARTPMAIGDANAGREPSAGRETGAAVLPRPRMRARILVVDDDAGVCAMTGEMLCERGYAVVLAESAEAALEILDRDSAFDLLLTDFVMPGMNGLGLIQAASEMHPAMRSMLMTGHAELNAGAPLGTERILQKPFNVALLDDRVCRALGRPRLQVIQGGVKASG